MGARAPPDLWVEAIVLRVPNRKSLSQVLTDRCTVAAYLALNTTTSDPSYTTSRDVTANSPDLSDRQIHGAARGSSNPTQGYRPTSDLDSPEAQGGELTGSVGPAVSP